MQGSGPRRAFFFSRLLVRPLISMLGHILKTALAIILVIMASSCVQSVDQYAKLANDDLLWSNDVWGLMEKVDDPEHNTEKVLAASFKSISFDEGKPKISECKIREAKTTLIGNDQYHIIKFVWKSVDRTVVIRLTEGFGGKWLVR